MTCLWRHGTNRNDVLGGFNCYDQPWVYQGGRSFCFPHCKAALSYDISFVSVLDINSSQIEATRQSYITAYIIDSLSETWNMSYICLLIFHFYYRKQTVFDKSYFIVQANKGARMAIVTCNSTIETSSLSALYSFHSIDGKRLPHASRRSSRKFYDIYMV